MSNKNKKIDDHLGKLLDEIEDEVDSEIEAEKIEKLSNQDKILAKVASKMLKLERDMTRPGSAESDSRRVERLIKFIEEEKF